MYSSSRRKFLKESATFITAACLGASFQLKKERLRLAFSTLGCPEWAFEDIVRFAEKHHYSGIEVRGLQKQMDLSKCPEFITVQKRREALNLMKKNGLRFVDLGSSANMHVKDTDERKKHLDEARSFIDLAGEINCPFVRVFPNKFPVGEEKAEVIKRIAGSLRELGDYASGRNVTLLMETHGDAVWSDDILNIMQAADHDQVGLVWDICNMWSVTKEPPAVVYSKLGKYTRHTHIKDAKIVKNELHYVLSGRGDVPIFEAIDVLAKNNYEGYYCFEWEKLWHPEIADPETALGDFPEAMNKHFE